MSRRRLLPHLFVFHHDEHVLEELADHGGEPTDGSEILRVVSPALELSTQRVEGGKDRILEG